ncbi:MAG: LysR family transcriptional regulator [Paracoccaceae bacterium]
MQRADLDALIPFLAVVEHGGFRAAARALGVQPSAVSQSIKAMEARLGTVLFARTTRSVALTEAGRALAERARPAMAEIADACEAARGFGRGPSGLLRLNAPRIALGTVLAPVLAPFREACPAVAVEVFLDDGLADIVAEGFDAGIRLGQLVEPDMVSVRLTPPSRMAVVASPDYLARRGRPRTPDDLAAHDCINFRRPTRRTLYHWRFVGAEGDVHVPVSGGVIVNDPAAKLHAARDGLGLAYEVEPVVRADVDAGRLEHVLEAHLPAIPGFHIYFPARAQVMAKLRAFVDFARERLAREEAAPARRP